MKKTSALLVLIFCTFLPVCGISGQRGLSPDICEVLSSTILMPYEIPNATRGNKTQKNTPAAYYYDEHGYAAACAFVRVEGCNEVFILGKHDGTWQIENRSRSIVYQQNERFPSITCEEYGKFYLAYLAEDGQAEEMISVLSAVAEIERENILVQTMEGRRQKAREGKWNGGFAPYGYKLVDGHLQIAEEEAEVIRIIYDKYIHTTMGTARIANWLNEHGYSKVCRHNNKREAFTGSFLIGVLDNPVYCGKLAYGRRHNEKIPGTRNQYHIVKQKDYALYDGIHEPIISEEDWQLAQKQRQQTNKRQLKTHSLDHEHVLSGLLKCPICGGGMYGNVNRKKKGDGTYYRDYFYYACKHRLHVDGKRCDYHHQWGEEIIDGAVEEIIRKLVNTPAFEQGIREKIGGKLDTAELDAEMEALRKQLRQLTDTKDRLGEQIDALDFDDPHYTRKAQDLQERQNRVYDQIASIEVSIAEVQTRMDNIRQRRISTDNVYQFLLYFDKLYDQFTDLEKKTFMNSFIERVEIYPERRSDGRIVKRIEFRFPVYFNGSKITGLGWDETDMSETVMVLSKLSDAEQTGLR